MQEEVQDEEMAEEIRLDQKRSRVGQEVRLSRICGRLCQLGIGAKDVACQ
jgi:hypothetical protein